MIYLKGSKIRVGSTGETAKVFQDLLALEDRIGRDKEHFYVMMLDVKSRIKMVEVVFVGTLTSSLVHPRETFRRAIVEGAASIIIAHNHPSGDPDPSDEDTKLTKLIFEAGQVLGISMIDHIVFAKDSFFSFRENRKEGQPLGRSAHLPPFANVYRQLPATVWSCKADCSRDTIAAPLTDTIPISRQRAESGCFRPAAATTFL